MHKASSPSKRTAFGPVSHRVDIPTFGRRADGELAEPGRGLADLDRHDLHSSTVLYAAAAFFAISATVAGLLAGGTLLPHRASDVRLELRGTLPTEDGVPAR